MNNRYHATRQTLPEPESDMESHHDKNLDPKEIQRRAKTTIQEFLSGNMQSSPLSAHQRPSSGSSHQMKIPANDTRIVPAGNNPGHRSNKSQSHSRPDSAISGVGTGYAANWNATQAKALQCIQNSYVSRASINSQPGSSNTENRNRQNGTPQGQRNTAAIRQSADHLKHIPGIHSTEPRQSTDRSQPSNNAAATHRKVHFRGQSIRENLPPTTHLRTASYEGPSNVSYAYTVIESQAAASSAAILEGHLEKILGFDTGLNPVNVPKVAIKDVGARRTMENQQRVDMCPVAQSVKVKDVKDSLRKKLGGGWRKGVRWLKGRGEEKRGRTKQRDEMGSVRRRI